MAHRIFAKTSVSITELKGNPMSSYEAGEGGRVAVMKDGKPAFYLVSPDEANVTIKPGFLLGFIHSGVDLICTWPHFS